MIFNHKVKAYAFVGPSGTGKSYRAQMVAGNQDIKFIIDDGLFIYENEVIAGISAKKAMTKVETVKNAIFMSEDKKKEMQNAIKKYKPDKILILGTSDEMVERIANNLEIGPIIHTTYITDVATPEEMEMARNIRVTQGKHVIPVPTFAIKKDFSGYLLDPLQIFKSNGKGNKPYVAEKSIIRPTFSYMGNFEISDTAVKQIIEISSENIDGIYKIHRSIIKKHSDADDGVFVYIEAIVEFGYNVSETIQKLKNKIVKDIEYLTAMNVLSSEIIAKGVHVDEEKLKRKD